MLNFPANAFLACFVAVLAGALATFAVRAYARSRGFVAKPKADRWHQRPTAMLGGVAIFATTVGLSFAFVPVGREMLALIGASTFLFFVGLVDDIVTVRPYQKLIGQLVGAGVIVGFGLTMPITGNEIVDIAITVFWLVGITNAINLLDNMDGLSAGISAIAALSLAASFAINGQVNETLLIAVFFGALIGFLIFNFNPASIFMGDCGSMFVGFFLAGSVLLNQVGGRSRGIFVILAVPALILFVPIFDTTFVTILRKAWGRKASQGGRDHTSHRLVALGLSERSAVIMLYAFAVVAGLLAIAISRLEIAQSMALIAGFSVILVIVGVYLSKVKVYEASDEELAVSNNAVFAFLITVSHKRRIFEVFLDIFLITLSYYAAFLLVLGPFEATGEWDLFIQGLPLVVLLKLSAFLLAGVYRGLWRYTSVSDIFTFAKGVALGSVLSVLALLLLYRFQFYSRTVFAVDAIILLMMIIGSRLAFRLIRQAIPVPVSEDGQRVVIFGAGDGGEMVLRELRNNPNWNYQAVAFVDDDPYKTGKVMHGLRVYDCDGSLESVLREKDAELLLISFRDVTKERLKSIRDICRANNVAVKRVAIRMESLDLE